MTEFRAETGSHPSSLTARLLRSRKPTPPVSARFFAALVFCFLPHLALAQSSFTEPAFKDLMERCVASVADGAEITTADLKLVEAGLAGEIAPDAEGVYFLSETGYRTPAPKKDWGYYLINHRNKAHCSVWAKPVKTGSAQADVWEELVTNRKFDYDNFVEDDRGTITQLYSADIDGTEIAVASKSTSAIRRTIEFTIVRETY